MVRKLVASTILVAAFTAGDASAQNYPSAGIYRGTGIWYDASGNYWAARANSINLDAAIRLDQYRRENWYALSDGTRRKLVKRRLVKERQEELQRRLRQSPTLR